MAARSKTTTFGGGGSAKAGAERLAKKSARMSFLVMVSIP
jgi:hypothetical protein